ncbi:MAG TPA: TonB-dependent receptor [Bryobacteraceae bacterium]|nr:TonB-dependent receptor [Bryobacteraceae bacterium]
MATRAFRGRVRTGATVLFVLALTPAVPLHAQIPLGSLVGRVVDSTFAGVPNAVVNATRLESNETFSARTNSTGWYEVVFVSPGVYNVQAAAPGFKTLRRIGVVIQDDDIVELTLPLSIGGVNEHVTVSGSSNELQTTTASRAYHVETEKLGDLPVVGRQAYSLVSLIPGVLFTQEQFGTTGFAGLRGWDTDGRFIINGGREGTNQFLLDGAPVSLTGRWQYSPNIEAIDDFKVMTNTYDAQFGRTGGGTVLTTVRSGTNGWHGDAYEYFHNSIFDANATENNSSGAPRGKHVTHEFGGIIGGPIRKDKDFVFISYEGFREIVPYPVVSDTPPLAIRDGQHFSNYNITIFDPLTAHACRAGIDTPAGKKCEAAYIRVPFPQDKIPLSRISPIGSAIVGLYPLPNGPGLTQNYIASSNVSRYNYNQPMGRWDHTFSDRDRISAVVAIDRGRDDTNTSGFPPPVQAGSHIAEHLDQNYIAEWTHIVSPAAVFDFRMSFGRFTEYLPDSSSLGGLTPEALGILQIPRPPTVSTDAPPNFSVDNYTSIIGNTYSWNTQNQWDFTPSIIQTRGAHLLHYGFEFDYAGIGNGGPGRGNGQFTFGRNWTQQYVGLSQNMRDGNGVADLLLGEPSSGYIDYNDKYYRTWPYYAGYIQDNWRIAHHLTLNLGVRYDVQIPFVERFNRVDDGFDFSAVNPLSAQIIQNWTKIAAQYDATHPRFPYPSPPAAIYGGRVFTTSGNRRPYNTDWTDLQPRLGVAWNFASKTVLRAGFGIFYRTATNMNQTSGFNQRTNYAASLDGGIKPSAGLSGPYALDNPYPGGIDAPMGSSLGLLTNIGNNISFDGRQRPLPRTYEYSFGFQRELPWGIFVDASYAGSQTVHDAMTAEYDAIGYANLLQGQADPLFLNRSLPSPLYGILPTNSTLGSALRLSAADLLRPSAIFNGITELTNPWARYRYDSLQITGERRVTDLAAAGVFTFLFSYTFSKSFADDHRLNNWNLTESPIHELSNLDKPQILAWSSLWDLPVGWGRHYFSDVGRFTGALINGWSVDWVFTYNSGYPVSQPDAVFTCGNYAAPAGQSAAHWFNNTPSCWQHYPPYALRTNPDIFPTIREPSSPQLDLAIQKTFWINDRYSLQFRGESFNIANTPILPGPATNFGDPRFGQLPLQQNNFPRYVQISAKLVF